MSKLIGAYCRLLNVLLVVSVAALLVPVTLQMISRLTGLIPAWIWTEEMARFLFIWMVMLGAMVAVRDGSHFDVDVWPDLKPKANALLRLVSSCFVLVLALVFAWWGWQFTSFGWNQTSEIADLFVLVMALVFIWYGIRFVQFGWDQTSELAELPMVWIFIAWPLLGVTWLLFVWEGWRRDLRLLAETGAAT